MISFEQLNLGDMYQGLRSDMLIPRLSLNQIWALNLTTIMEIPWKEYYFSLEDKESAIAS